METSIQSARAFLAIGISVLLGACQTDVRPDLPTLAGNEYGYDIQQYRGQSVKVCGRASERESRFAVEYIPKADDSFHHGYPAVLVVPCAGETPRVDRRGCIAGRVAAEDGSMIPPQRRIRSNAPYSLDWFVHAQCRSSR